jgi:hypothetical protein
MIANKKLSQNHLNIYAVDRFNEILFVALILARKFKEQAF